MVAIFVSCAKKTESLQVSGWQKYEEIYTHISFVMPKDWVVVQEGTKLTLYNSQEAVHRFIDLQGGGKDGVRLIVSAEKMDTLQTIEEKMNEKFREDQETGFDMGTISDKSLADIPGKFYDYSGFVDAKSNRLSGQKFIAVRDSMVYRVNYEGFNELYQNSKFVLDTLLKTLKIPVPLLKKNEQEDVSPSATFTRFENNRLAISYPDNFEVDQPTPKSPAEYSMDLRGYRQDCFIHLDIIPAKGLAPEKVVEQNAKFYKETSRGTVTIADVPTTYLNYSPRNDVSSRVYFIVKNDKIHRIIFNYFTPMKQIYLPVFEKTISTLAVK
jgi:hypothetical protein